MKNLTAFKLDAEEHMVLKFRKHWFILLRDASGTALSVILPPLALLAARWLGLDVFTALPTPLVTFFILWWFLVVWLALSIIWTNYYLDLWLVTDKRLVSVDQTGLFYREVTTLPLSNVQDVTVEQYGVIATLLNFGTLTVQTAGPTTNNMSTIGIARPGDIRTKISRQCEIRRQKAQATPPMNLIRPEAA